MATSENWQLFVHNERQNHKIVVYNHSHAQDIRLMEEHLQQTEQFRKSHVPPRNILQFFREQDVGCAVRVQKIYNVVAKIKKNKMKGRKTVEEVLCLSAQQGYTVFYRNCEESNLHSDIVVAHQHQFQLLECGNMYNMPLLEAVGMTPTGKNITVATAFMCNEQTTTYIWTRWQRRPDFLHYLFNTWLNPLAHKFYRVWTSEVLHFGVEITNRAESEHSVLKLWLSTCHGDLDTTFLNIDSLIEGQIAEIKTSLEIPKLKEKYSAKSNLILKNISHNISHLALKRIWLEIKRPHNIFDNT
ncbi:hypothetical protein M9H77_21924 [Catharanthus roseus]|uniref:Uncharacterized protein n=1 Tax=Catharanthus roseus TaxID=4058 RepID=A0ACC0APR1_CATRO|nr:hypothetical protein M9H77_21924 [Catharanthus roseus]